MPDLFSFEDIGFIFSGLYTGKNFVVEHFSFSCRKLLYPVFPNSSGL